MQTQQNILKATYDLLKASIEVIGHFPRKQQYGLGERLQNQVSDLLECYIEARYRSGERKRERLETANLTLEKLRYYFRLAYDLGFFNKAQYQGIYSKIQEIGRMTGGWIKHLQ